jgi:formylglycine-generating enzyme required for sulfatase activity
MNTDTDLVLVKYSDCFVKVAFFVSRYPVTQGDYITLAEGRSPTPEDDRRLYRTTWLAAIQFCNRFSAHHRLPQPYCEETGQLIDREQNPTNDLSSVGGFRLPTLKEWEYAAHGWSGSKTGSYFPIHKEHYKVPGLDYPTTDQQKELYEHGYSRKDEMVANSLGICGMLVYGREWFADCGVGSAPRNGLCYWEEYFTNYNNDIGYQVTNRSCEDKDEHAFRVVINEQDLKRLGG